MCCGPPQHADGGGSTRRRDRNAYVCVCVCDGQVVNLFSRNLIGLEQMTVTHSAQKPHWQLLTCPLQTKKGTLLCSSKANLFPGLEGNWKWWPWPGKWQLQPQTVRNGLFTCTYSRSVNIPNIISAGESWAVVHAERWMFANRFGIRVCLTSLAVPCTH